MGDTDTSQNGNWIPGLSWVPMAIPPEPLRDLDWSSDQARNLGEGALDLWMDFLETLPRLPIDRALTVGKVKRAVLREVPGNPVPVEELLTYARSVMLENSVYVGNGGFMAYVSGPGTVPGAGRGPAGRGRQPECRRLAPLTRRDRDRTRAHAVVRLRVRAAP